MGAASPVKADSSKRVRGWSGLGERSSTSSSTMSSAFRAMPLSRASTGFGDEDMIAERPFPRAFLVMLQNLFCQILIRRAADARPVVETDRLAERGRLRQPHVARGDRLKKPVAEI